MRGDTKDMLSLTQQHFNYKFNKEMCVLKNYQNNLDQRLSRPKRVMQIQEGRKTFVTKNTIYDQVVLKTEEEEDIPIRDKSWCRSDSPTQGRQFKRYTK